MNDDQPMPPRPDRLERAMDAMRNVTAGPMPMIVMTQPPRGRQTVVARVAVAACVAAILAGGAATFLRPTPALALADVAAATQKTRTFRAAVVAFDGKGKARDTGVLMGRDRRVRFEVAGGTVSIADLADDRSVTLDAVAKTATTHIHVDDNTEMLALLCQWPDDAGRRIGDRIVGGRSLVGFEVPVNLNAPRGKSPPRGRAEVWADPATRLPVRIEFFDSVDRERRFATIERIEFDPPLDDALFSLDPPAGYALLEGVGIRPERLRPAATTREAAALTLTPGLGIGAARLGMTKADVLAALGLPDQDRGNQVNYFSRGFTLLFYGTDPPTLAGIGARAADDVPYSASRDFPGQTDRGIRLGATRDAVAAAYGKAGEVTRRPGVDEWSYPSGIRFKFDDAGRVVGVSIASPWDAH